MRAGFFSPWALVFRKKKIANTIITLNYLFLPCTSDERKVLTKYSIITLKISNDETVDQLRIMIRERWPSLFEKTPPANFILCEIDDIREDTSIDKQINEYALGKHQNGIEIAPYELISRYFPHQPSNGKINIIVEI